MPVTVRLSRVPDKPSRGAPRPIDLFKPNALPRRLAERYAGQRTFVVQRGDYLYLSWPLPTIQIIDRNGRDGVRGRETEDDTIEEQLGFETSGDRVGHAESVLLAFEREEGHRQTLRPNGIGHRA